MSATDSPLSAPTTPRAPVDADRVCAGTFMLLVDVTIVQVALPTIQRHLGAHSRPAMGHRRVRAQPGCAHPHLGSISDRFGRKHVFIAGLACSRRPHCSAVSPIDLHAHLVTRPSRRRRRSDVRDRSRPHRPGFPGSGAWQGDRGVGPPWRRGRDRTARRRVADERHRLALDLHRQRAYWRRGDLALLDKDAQPEGPRRDSPRRLRPRQFLCGMFLLELGLIRGNSLGWSSGQLSRCSAVPCRPLSPSSSSNSTRTGQCRPLALSQTQLSGVSLGTFAVAAECSH